MPNVNTDPDLDDEGRNGTGRPSGFIDQRSKPNSAGATASKSRHILVAVVDKANAVNDGKPRKPAEMAKGSKGSKVLREAADRLNQRRR